MPLCARAYNLAYLILSTSFGNAVTLKGFFNSVVASNSLNLCFSIFYRSIYGEEGSKWRGSLVWVRDLFLSGTFFVTELLFI